MLDPPHCPNCHASLDLKELWREAEKNGNAMIQRLAFVCPVCGVKLRVLPGRAFLISVLSFIIPFALIVTYQVIAPMERHTTAYVTRMLIFMVTIWGGAVLCGRQIPRFLTVRRLKENEVIRYPLAPPVVAHRQTGLSALELEPLEDGRPNWVCPTCGEDNPGNFDECWKCQTWRAEKIN